jgi:3-oxoadipate enol-lactonase
VEHTLVGTALGRQLLQIGGDPAGEVMAFWPSLLMTGDMWAALAEHFGRSRRVVLVDPPGHGLSERLTCTRYFERCAQCVVDILDHLATQRADVVGNLVVVLIAYTQRKRFSKVPVDADLDEVG